jgi:hypothetical protein
VYHHVVTHYECHVCYGILFFKHVVILIMIDMVVLMMTYSLYD